MTYSRIFENMFRRNFRKITHILTNIHFLAQWHIITRIRAALSFIVMSHRLLATFSKKSDIDTQLHIFGIGGLDKLWSDFNHFWCEMIYFDKGFASGHFVGMAIELRTCTIPTFLPRNTYTKFHADIFICTQFIACTV